MWNFLFCASECTGCFSDCGVTCCDNNMRIPGNGSLRTSVATWLLNAVELVISV